MMPFAVSGETAERRSVMKYYKLIECDKCPSEAWAEAKDTLASLTKHICNIVKEEQNSVRKTCGQIVYPDLIIPVLDGNVKITDGCIIMKPNGVATSDVVYPDNRFAKEKHINCTLSFLNQVNKVLSEVTAEQIRRHIEEKLAN